MGLSFSKHENLPIATKVAEQVICLPIFPDLDNDTIEFICKIFMK